MQGHLRHATWMLALLVGALAGPVRAQSGRVAHILEDATLSGEQIHAFAKDGQATTVVLGDFRFQAGEYLVSGRDAVLWIQTRRFGQAQQHEITIYVEGNPARVSEPNGTSLRDTAILATMRIQGRIAIKGRISGRDLSDFPLVQAAERARKAGRARPVEPTTQPVRPSVTTQPATTQPVRMPAPPEQGPRIPTKPVQFYAEKFSTQRLSPTRRVTIARGKVYLSQGDPEWAQYLELRAQSAVIFSEVRKEWPDDPAQPYLPKLSGLKVEGGEERITGVYLEGDVVIARGERYLRGKQAFYDFGSYRAIVTEPVFRTIQEQRNVPIYVRASEARALSAREMWFKNARISTSDFYTPTYHVGAHTARVKDLTPYDPIDAEALGEDRFEAELTHTTFAVRGLPIAYLPFTTADLEREPTALRSVRVGQFSKYGFGGETEWHLFRLLGLVRPEGIKSQLELNYYERGPFIGSNWEYARQDLSGNDYTGYGFASYLHDSENEDDFGKRRRNIDAPDDRGRILMRHKHYLPGDWQVQFELSYYCDRNFLEEFYPSEFHAGKEQETLLYAKKQKDNWAVTGLIQYRLNRFDTQTESWPEVGFHWIGQPLLDDLLTFHTQSTLGAKRWVPDNLTERTTPASDVYFRGDTRNELALPLKIQVPGEDGPTIHVVPYGVGRLTYWSETPSGSDRFRPAWVAGMRASTQVWKLYPVSSRVWDIHGLRHIIAPEVVGWVGGVGGVHPEDVYPADPGVEQHLDRVSGVNVGLYQRLQTKRGPADDRRVVDWMRLNLVAGFFSSHEQPVPTDGHSYFDQPEYSLPRNHLRGEYQWNISDATALLADVNYDINRGRIAQASSGLAISRNPRLKYYLGWRYVEPLDSSVGTIGVKYQINEKYSLSAFQQYDFDFRGGDNLRTSVGITRRFPRWLASFTFIWDARHDELSFLLTLTPEGIPEVRLGTGRINLSGSDMN